MNKSELKERLEREGARTNLYTLEGGFPNEAYVLNRTGNQWEVYYSERGQKSGLEIFDNENDACEYLYKDLKRFVIK